MQHTPPIPIMDHAFSGTMKRSPNWDDLTSESHKKLKHSPPILPVISLLSDDEDDATEPRSVSQTANSPDHKSTPNHPPYISTPHSSPISAPTINPVAEARALARAAAKQPKLPYRPAEVLSAANIEEMPGTWPSTPARQAASHDRWSPTNGPIPMPTLLSSSQGELQPESAQPIPPVSEEPPLCPEQAALVDLVASGKNVFYTGSAGCGKSTALKAITKQLRSMGKTVRIIAPTGCSALQVNGTTTWTFAGWTPNHHKRSLDELRAAAHGKFVWKRLNEADVLIIDEISMIENLHFERLNELMKAARGKDRAFGGIQVIVTGDFCQLPPVKPFEHCIECGRELIRGSSELGTIFSCRKHGDYYEKDKFAFRSRAWQECNFDHVQLTTIHRQNDETFIHILQKCRTGQRLSESELDLLMDHECMVHHATKLFATRDEMNKVNRAEFERLKGLNHIYWCLDNFFWQPAHPNLQWKGVRKPKDGPQSKGPIKALEDHRFPECVQLKKGMLVVLLVNLDLASGLCNGSQGIICGFEQNDPKLLPKAKTNSAKDEPVNRTFGERAQLQEEQIKLFIEDPGARYKTWPVVRFHNGQVRTIYASCSISELGDDRPHSLLCRTQIPLAPAWAMTIHKSQGMTLDRVVVNLSRAFEEGQVYVALSRATGLRGLKIEGSRAGLLTGLGGNREVQAFLRDKFGAVNAHPAVQGTV